jgi:hypothetical protein
MISLESRSPLEKLSKWNEREIKLRNSLSQKGRFMEKVRL